MSPQALPHFKLRLCCSSRPVCPGEPSGEADEVQGQGHRGIPQAQGLLELRQGRLRLQVPLQGLLQEPLQGLLQETLIPSPVLDVAGWRKQLRRHGQTGTP